MLMANSTEPRTRRSREEQPRKSRNPPRPARDGSLVERCGIPRTETSRRDDTFYVVLNGTRT